MVWFRRKSGGITTETKDKKDLPEGLWFNCPKCKAISSMEDHSNNLWVCSDCNFHERINAKEYFSFLFDNQKFTELNGSMQSTDPLKFHDKKKYTERLKDAIEKTGLKDAITTAHGKINGKRIVVGAMNFNFIGGSMGSVVGEKINLAIDYSLEEKIPLLLISKSGGARMMEAAFSLMQLAKTSAKLALLSKQKIPYISLLTDPTTGGITASFAMLGDINIAEPGALIGFAGPRVVKETIGKDLPEGFQTSEFVLEHGFLDFIVHRKDIKNKITKYLNFIEN